MHNKNKLNVDTIISRLALTASSIQKLWAPASAGTRAAMTTAGRGILEGKEMWSQCAGWSVLSSSCSLNLGFLLSLWALTLYRAMDSNWQIIYTIKQASTRAVGGKYEAAGEHKFPSENVTGDVQPAWWCNKNRCLFTHYICPIFARCGYLFFILSLFAYLRCFWQFGTLSILINGYVRHLMSERQGVILLFEKKNVYSPFKWSKKLWNDLRHSNGPAALSWMMWSKVSYKNHIRSDICVSRFNNYYKATPHTIFRYDLCTIVNLMVLLRFYLFMDGLIRTVVQKSYQKCRISTSSFGGGFLWSR